MSREQYFFRAFDSLLEGPRTPVRWLGNRALVDPTILAHDVGAALDEVGIPFTDFYFENMVHAAGTWSQVARAHAQLEGGLLPLAVRVTSLCNADYAAQEDLAAFLAREAGLSVPKTYVDSLDYSPSETPDYFFSVMEFAEGKEGFRFCQEGGPQAVELTVDSMGLVLAGLHRIKAVQGFGYFDTNEALQGRLVGEFSSYRSRINACLSQSLGYLVDKGHLGAAKAEELDRFFRESPEIDELEALGPVLSHGDVAPHNFIFRPDNPDNPYTLIDFGEAQAGPSLYDIAVSSFQLQHVVQRATQSELIEAYIRHGGVLPKNAPRLLEILDLRLAICRAPAYIEYLSESTPFQEAISRFYKIGMEIINTTDIT